MNKIRQHASQVRLWPRMALGISLGFLVLFAAFFLLGENALQANTSRLMAERLGFAQAAASSLDRLLDQATAELEAASSFADFDPEDTDLRAERHVLDHTLGRGVFFKTGTYFLDAQGRVRAAYPPGDLQPGADMTGDFELQLLYREGIPVISSPFLFSSDAHPVAAVTVPLVNNGQVVGALGGLIDLDSAAVQGVLEETAGFAQTGHSLLVDASGQVIVSAPALPFLFPGDHVDFYREVIAAGTPRVAVVDQDRSVEEGAETHLMALAPLKRVPWGVAVGGSSDEIFAGVWQLRQGFLWLGGVVLLGIWGLTLVGTRRLVKPVQQLTRDAQRVAAGELEVKLEAPEGGEIGELAAALDHMRQQLLEHITQLGQARDTLEDQVVQRTAALRQQKALAQQLLRRLFKVQEDERARISRELHDETGQILTAIQINLERLEKKLAKNREDAMAHLELVQTLTEQMMVGLREIIADLRPALLDQLGLVPALERMIAQTLQPLGVTADLETDLGNMRLPPDVETVLFRIAQEAISNVIHHSQAAHFHVRIEYHTTNVVMRLMDNGTGFNPLKAASDPEFKRGLGLATMQERASLLGGKITLESAPRRGTTIHVFIPLPTTDDQEEEMENGR